MYIHWYCCHQPSWLLWLFFPTSATQFLWQYLYEHNSLTVCINNLLQFTSNFYKGTIKDSGFTYILQDKTLFSAFEAGDIVCWLVNQPIAKLDLFKSPGCWICKTYAEYCNRNSATVRRLVKSPTLQSTIFCGVHSDLCGKGIRVSPAWYNTPRNYTTVTPNGPLTFDLIGHIIIIYIFLVKMQFLMSKIVQVSKHVESYLQI